MKNKTLKLFILFNFIIVSEITFGDETNINNNVKEPKNTNFLYTEESDYEKNTKQNERIFPLFKEGVEARNIHLPLPFGVSFLGNVTNVKADGTGIDITGANHSGTIQGLSVKEDITAQISGVMLDFYPLPFLNVFGYGGVIQTNGDLDLGLEFNPPGGGDPIGGTVQTKFGDTGKAYGFGANISGGYKHFFAGVNGSLSFVTMDKTGAAKKTFIITPRIGVKSDSNKFQMWTGLMYMNKSMKLDGDMPAGAISSNGFESPAFSYSLNLDGPSYSPTLGFRYEPIEHFEIICEGFFASDFNGVNMRIGYRF